MANPTPTTPKPSLPGRIGYVLLWPFGFVLGWIFAVLSAVVSPVILAIRWLVYRPRPMHAVVQGTTQSGKSTVSVHPSDRRLSEIIRNIRNAEYRRRAALDRGDSFEGVFVHGDEWTGILESAGVKLAALLLALGLCAAPAAAVEWTPWTVDAYALGVSAHWKDTDRRWHNPGAGLGLSGYLNEWSDATIHAFRYRDSLGRGAWAFSGGLRGYLGERRGWHLTGEAAIGDLRGSGHSGIVAAPILGAGWRWVSVEATADPNVNQSVAAAWLAFRWEVQP